MKFLYSIYLLVFMVLNPFIGYSQKPREIPTDFYIDNLFHITEVMVTDVAAPPAAARFYAYTTLAAHLAWEMAANPGSTQSLLAKSNIGFNDLPKAETGIVAEFAAIYTMLEVGKRIMPSGKLLEPKQKDLIREFSKRRWLRKKDVAVNIAYAEALATSVMAIAKADGYNKLSTFTRYSPKTKEGHWYPTPPAYMAPVEPEWRTMRTFFLKNLQDYKPEPPAAFDLSEGSSFKLQLDEVWKTSKNLTEEQELIANFWDCNPFKVDFSGHMAIGIKKISPGGHWIGITGIACKKASLDWKKTLYIHALVGMGLHDAFVSCWEEKYDSDRIRPESAINKYLDPAWKPILQTPPFPEYTSGHSVISRTSAEILTAYFGDDFDFVDNSEVYFGLPERPFKSFFEASEEAAISRLYGGIHFRDAIEQGSKQGEKIGKYIVQRVR